MATGPDERELRRTRQSRCALQEYPWIKCRQSAADRTQWHCHEMGRAGAAQSLYTRANDQRHQHCAGLYLWLRQHRFLPSSGSRHSETEVTIFVSHGPPLASRPSTLIRSARCLLTPPICGSTTLQTTVSEQMHRGSQQPPAAAHVKTPQASHPLPLFQLIVRDHPPRRDDVCAVRAIAAERRAPSV